MEGFPRSEEDAWDCFSGEERERFGEGAWEIGGIVEEKGWDL